MIWGQYTCPAWQGYRSDTTFIGSSYTDEYNLVETFKNKVQVLHLVGPEPHPYWPYANFDSGLLKMNLWSTIDQPLTYESRLATSVEKVKDRVHPNVSMK